MVSGLELWDIPEGSEGYVRGTAFFKRNDRLWISADAMVLNEPKRKTFF